MTILLLHISDIHLTSSSNIILQRVDKLARAATSIEPKVEHAIVLATGDIAYAGAPEEYTAALRLFTTLHEALKNRLRAQSTAVDVIILPGNHDCNFQSPQDVRNMVLKGVAADPSKRHGDDIIRTMAQPQEQFRKFVDALRQTGISPLPETETLLCSTYLIGESAHVVRINCINTAWASELHETPGKLIVPLQEIPDNDPEVTPLVITAFHHPLQWLRPENARAFLGLITRSADLVLTGHEHTMSHHTISALSGGNFAHVEAPVLQDPKNSADSGFNVFILDAPERKQMFTSFSWSGQTYNADTPSSKIEWRDLPLNNARTCSAFRFSHSHEEFLDDPELHLDNRGDGDLILPDFFVFPDLLKISVESETVNDIVQGQKVAELIDDNPMIVITGDDCSGKTAFGKMLCRTFHNKGDAPLFLRARKPATKLQSLIAEAIEQQYGVEHVEPYSQLDTERRVIVVDDFERLAPTQKLQKDLISNLGAKFGRVILFANDFAFDVSGNASPAAMSLPHYSIQPLGYLRRNELVEKWLSKTPEDDAEKVVRRVAELTRTLNNIVGTGFVPAYPVYVLAVLHAAEASVPIDTGVSTNGYYYELLIRTALLSGSSPKEFDVLTGYLAYIAFRMFQTGDLRVAKSDFMTFHEDYESRRDIRISLDAMISQLCSRRMLQEVNDVIQFRYPYVYYYFVASYLRDHLADMEVRAHIRELARDAHHRRCGDILIFLAHLSKDEFIINTLLNRAEECYRGTARTQSLDDVSLPGEFHEAIERVAYEERDVREVRREIAAARDGLLANERAEADEIDDDCDRPLDPLRELNAALRTLQVLGQILKNYPGHLEAKTKLDLSSAAYGIGTRAWRAIFDQIANNKEELARDLVNVFREQNPHASAQVVKTRAQNAMHELVFLCAFGMIKRLSAALGAPELTLTYRKLVRREASEAVWLTRIAIELDHNPATPEGELEKTYRKIKETRLSALVLRHLAVEHFYLFPASPRVKQRICSKLGIRYKSGLASKQKQKLLPAKQRR